MKIKNILIILLSTFLSFGAALHESSSCMRPDTSYHPETCPPEDGTSSGPRLLSTQKLPIPLGILKRDTINEVIAEIKISREGKVETCAIENDRQTLLDSIVRATVLRSNYSPAFENGVAVPSQMTIRISFTIDNAIANLNAIPSDIEGVILDRETKQPLTDAIINIQFEDTLGDPDVRIGFDRYLQLIGRVPGQTCYRGVLSTKADSSGRFAFKLLPFGRATLSVSASGHEITHFSETPREASRTIVKYFLDGIRSEMEPSDTVIVYGSRSSAAAEKINVEREQVTIGLTHCMSDLLVSRTAIRQVPEAASLLLVRSGSPFNNRYFIAGVPFLAPFHFGGYSYIDMDGIMISSLRDVRFTLDRIAGRSIDVSGILVEVEPGIVRPANPRLLRRPELVLDFSGSDADMQLSVPVGKGKENFAQVATKLANDHSMPGFYGVVSGAGEGSDMGIGQPWGFSDYALTVSNTIDSIRIQSFIWLAIDKYNVPGQWPSSESASDYPWGMASVRFKPLGIRGVSVLTGGSHQYFSDGKRVGFNSFLKTVFLSNGVVEAKWDTLMTATVQADADIRVVYNKWHGSVIQRDPRGVGYSWYAHGEEVECALHGALNKSIGRFRVGTDMVTTGISYGEGKKVLYDAGISLRYELPDFLAGICCGRVTGRPDIRGLPDSSFRTEESHTWLFSMPCSVGNGDRFKFSIQPYLRNEDKCFRMDPYLTTWFSPQTTGLVAKGVDADVEYHLKDWAVLHTAANFADASRMRNGRKMIYEWNNPFTLRSGSHLSFSNNRVHWYVDYVFSKGLPYYDFNAAGYRKLPDYSRIDMSLQYRVSKGMHRFITRYDGYINVFNLTDSFNIRGYYWDARLNRRSLFLGGIWFDMGLKAGFRL